MKLLSLFSDTLVFLIGASILCGVFFAEWLAPLDIFSTVLLGIIFFIIAIELDLKNVREALFDLRIIAIVTLTMLVGLPLVVFGVTSLFAPALVVPFVLLAAMPTGMTAPVVARLADARVPLVAVCAVITSLFAPFTVPFIMDLLVGSRVSVETIPMLISLLTVICIPFFLGRIARSIAPRFLNKVSLNAMLSRFFLGLLIAIIVAKQIVALEAIGWTDTLLLFIGYTLLAEFVLFIFLHALGYFVFFMKPEAERLALMVSITYMNFTLAIFIADTYFSAPQIIVPVMLSVIPWSLSLIPMQILARYRLRIERNHSATV